NQLNELLETEEASRKNVEELRPAIKEMAEMLNENKNIYDRGKLRFEIEIEELTDGLNTYDDLVENGDYHQAKDVVDKLNEELKKAKKQMAEILNEYKNIYDRSKLRFEIEIEELTDGLNTDDDLVENGDYHQGKDVVDKLNEELKRVQTELEEFPELYQK